MENVCDEVKRKWLAALFSCDQPQLDEIMLDIAEALCNCIESGSVSDKDGLIKVEQCFITLLLQRSKLTTRSADSASFQSVAAAVTAQLIEMEAAAMTRNIQDAAVSGANIKWVLKIFLRDSLEHWLDAILQSSAINAEIYELFGREMELLCMTTSASLAVFIKLVVLCRKLNNQDSLYQKIVQLKVPTELRNWLRQFPFVPTEIVDGKRKNIVKWLLTSETINEEHLDDFLDVMMTSLEKSKECLVNDDSVVAPTISTTSVATTLSAEEDLFALDTQPQLEHIDDECFESEAPVQNVVEEEELHPATSSNVGGSCRVSESILNDATEDNDLVMAEEDSRAPEDLEDVAPNEHDDDDLSLDITQTPSVNVSGLDRTQSSSGSDQEDQPLPEPTKIIVPPSSNNPRQQKRKTVPGPTPLTAGGDFFERTTRRKRYTSVASESSAIELPVGRSKPSAKTVVTAAPHGSNLADEDESKAAKRGGKTEIRSPKSRTVPTSKRTVLKQALPVNATDRQSVQHEYKEESTSPKDTIVKRRPRTKPTSSKETPVTPSKDVVIRLNRTETTEKATADDGEDESAETSEAQQLSKRSKTTKRSHKSTIADSEKPTKSRPTKGPVVASNEASGSTKMATRKAKDTVTPPIKMRLRHQPPAVPQVADEPQCEAPVKEKTKPRARSKQEPGDKTVKTSLRRTTKAKTRG